MAEGSYLFSVTLLPLLGSHRKHLEFNYFGYSGALTCWQQPAFSCRRRPNAQKLGVGGTAVDPLLQDRASGEIRVLVELDHRTLNASKDRDRDRMTAAGGQPTVRLSARVRPARASVAAAAAPTMARATRNKQSEGNGKWLE